MRLNKNSGEFVRPLQRSNMSGVLEDNHLRTLDPSLVRFTLTRARPIMIAIDQRHRDVDLSVIRSRRDVARKASINGTRNV